MLSRALSLATVTLLIGCLTAGAARAVENLDAGKSPSQIFSNTCSACHKSPRGLLKNTSPSSLPGFLRPHYTTGTDMASLLSSYLISNGAADPRYQGKDQQKQKDAKQDGRPDQPDRLGRRQPPAAPAQQASRPNADGAPPQGEGARPGRDAKRLARPQTAPDAAKPADGQAPACAALHLRLQAHGGLDLPALGIQTVQQFRQRRRLVRVVGGEEPRSQAPPEASAEPEATAAEELQVTLGKLRVTVEELEESKAAPTGSRSTKASPPRRRAS